MDFTQALDGSASEFEPPKLMPIGTYTWAVTKPPETKEVGKDTKYDMVTFQLKCISPEEDVDPDDLDDFGKVANQPMRKTFLFTKDPDDKNGWLRTMDDLKRFLYQTLQIEQSETLKEDMAGASKCHLLGVIKHVPDKRSEGAFQAEIGSTAPIS